jgi:serine/threonine-protein kinase RsbW
VVNNARQISRAAELACLSVLRDFIDTQCTGQPGVDEPTRYDLKLAVDEACTNIIKHGYAGMNPGSIILRVDVEPEKVILTITDFGHAFEPYETSLPDIQAGLEDRPMGGFGLYFIYQTMDQVEYETNEDGNCLRLSKFLQPVQKSI